MRFAADFLIFQTSAAYYGAILPKQLESGAVWVTDEEKHRTRPSGRLQETQEQHQSDVSGSH